MVTARQLALMTAALLTSACLAYTDGTGKGSGKETSGCVEGVLCEMGLECVAGFCVSNDAGDDPLDEDTLGDEASSSGTESTDDTDGTDGTSDSSTESDSGDEESTSDGESTGTSCGDGVVDPGEQCDGADLSGASCASLGYDEGALACSEACTFNLSTCSNGPQPGLGELYSHCFEKPNCPGLHKCATLTEEGSEEVIDGFCTNFCMLDSQCWVEDVGGSAYPFCNDEQPSSWCQLDCAEGKTCPQGMVCIALTNGEFACH